MEEESSFFLFERGSVWRPVRFQDDEWKSAVHCVETSSDDKMTVRSGVDTFNYTFLG